ncbi:hypothetical protein ACS0TY_001205 [Phlomoides rotata]
MSLLADSRCRLKQLSECSKSRSKLSLSRDYAEIYGESECSGNVKKPRFSYGAAIAALPLRSLPSGNVKWNPVGEVKKSWESDSEKLDAVLADAKKIINQLNVNHSESIEEGKAFGMEAEEEDDDEEVRVLTHEEWSMLPLYHKEKCSSHKSNGELQNKIVDFVDLCSVGAESDQQSEMILGSTETENREEYQEQSFMDLDSKCNENCDGLINLQIGKHEQPQHADVMETLKLFREKYDQLKKCTSEIGEGKIPKPAHTAAGELVKEMGMCNFVEKPFGHIPGIEIGDAFRFRAELAVVGLHGHFVSGINYVHVNGKICATSVVESGQYENAAKTDDVLIYSGQGGNPKLKGKASDQKLERGNLALVHSMEMRYPIRVIFKRRNVMACRTLDTNVAYVYDGLYIVNDYWQRRGEHGKLVFKFELRRLSSQPRPREANAMLSKPIKRVDVCVLNDVSQGKEKFAVRVVNGVDDDLPPPFTYITEIVYPYWFKRVELIGCNCTDGCSNFKKCPCALKNVDNITCNEDGAILGAKPRVHECGPSCKCPPSCKNRVSQYGPHYQLEVFKTESRGWGVRSRNYISKGSFVCEYIGELSRMKEVKHKIGNDEYLLHIWKGYYEEGQGLENGFALDSTMCGNIGRFINHSYSPNLIVKEVFYDHDDKRMPHIMFFASKNIGHSQELTYDYMKTKND